MTTTTDHRLREERVLTANQKKVHEYFSKFDINFEKLTDIHSQLGEAFNHGLEGQRDGYYFSPVRMLPTHLSVVPDGTEKGQFLALDLGGTNLRIIQIFVVDGNLHTVSHSYKVSEEAMTGTADKLFDYVAECIEAGLKEIDLLGKEIDFFGYTFSFPVSQRALNSGILIKWTKGYSASGVEGQDVVDLLRKACNKRNLNIKDYVLINDTTGTLLCGAFESKDAKIGVIVGTGTNACYLEDLSNVKTWTTPTHHKKIIINTEWGAFGEHGELERYLTDIDRKVDEDSINRGKQIYEKMISGMYICEIARLAILEYQAAHPFFEREIPSKMMVKHELHTSLMSESCLPPPQFFIAFKKHFHYDLSEKEAEIITEIFNVVVKRSARLCAAGLAALVKRIDCPKAVIAADGSLVRKHPKYVAYVNGAIKALIPDRDFEIKLVNDGSGKGAALAACVATTAAKNKGYQSA